MGIKVLVSGDRNWKDHTYLESILTAWHALKDIEILIEGGARGADTMAQIWAMKNESVSSITVPANWDQYGRAAGPIRNQKMLDEYHPDVVLAFHKNISESKGTKHMINASLRAGVDTYLYDGKHALRVTEEIR